MNTFSSNHKQKIEYARASLWAPFYTVGMAARVRGDAPPELVREALRKLAVLYPPLASRVMIEKGGSAWLTQEGVGEFDLQVRAKTSDDDWAKVFLEQERIPFAFERGPIARFFLLRGERTSDLIAIVPHVICDGYSMSQVMAAMVALLNDPGREAARPPTPPSVTWKTVPHAVSDNLLLRGFARALNATWPNSRVVLRQEAYEELHRCYWSRQQNRVLSFVLSPAETSGLAARCKQKGVSITGALAAGFLLAQSNTHPVRTEVSIAVNIRDRMSTPPGHAFGVFASSVDFQIRADPGGSFWDLAREGHARLHKELRNRPKILLPLVLEELDPSIVDAVVTAVSTDRWGPEFGLVTPFIKVKGEARRLDVSNIGRVNVPEVGAPYTLETILPFPPLVPGAKLALNVLTLDGHMNLILKYRQDVLDDAAARRITDRAFDYLFNG